MATFNRTFQLSIDTITEGERKIIEPPFTVDFDITRNILSSQSLSSFKIYNLAETVRNALYMDRIDFRRMRGLQFKAGYDDQLAEIFRGSISHCWSVRQGVNFITTIEAYDAGFAFVTAEYNKTVPKGTNQTSLIQDMFKTFEPGGIQPGAIGDFRGSLPRGNTYSGNTADLLKELTNGAFFVDMGKVHALHDDECIEGSIKVIDSDSGLLGTPTREDAILTVEMIFEPKLLVGQQVTLQSSTDKTFNKQYKVIGIKHRGTISDAVSSRVTTTVNLFFGPQLKIVGQSS